MLLFLLLQSFLHLPFLLLAQLLGFFVGVAAVAAVSALASVADVADVAAVSDVADVAAIALFDEVSAVATVAAIVAVAGVDVVDAVVCVDAVISSPPITTGPLKNKRVEDIGHPFHPNVTNHLIVMKT